METLGDKSSQSSCRVVSSSLHGRVATCQKKMTKNNTCSSWRSSYSSAIQVMNWLRSPSSLDHHLHPVLGVVNARKFSWNHKQLWFCRSTSISNSRQLSNVAIGLPWPGERELDVVESWKKPVTNGQIPGEKKENSMTAFSLQFANQVLSKTASKIHRQQQGRDWKHASVKVQTCSKDAFSMKMAMIRLKTPRQTSMNMHT